MDNIVSVIYEFLGNILIYFAEIPGEKVLNGSAGILITGAAIMFIFAVLLFLMAVGANGNSYVFYIKLLVGAVPIFLIAQYAVLMDAGVSIKKEVIYYNPIIWMLIFIGAIGFLIVNILLEPENGRVIGYLWSGEFLLMAGSMRLWEFVRADGRNPDYSLLLLVSRVLNPFTNALNSIGFQSATRAIEFLALMGLMFITVYVFAKSSAMVEKEWGACISSQIVMAAAYLLFEMHVGVPWSYDHAFMAFLLFCTGLILYLFLFCFEVHIHEQERCIGVFMIGIAGIVLDIAVILGTDMVRLGAMESSLNKLAAVMTFIYDKTTFGIHTDFTKGNFVMPIIGSLTVLILAVILVLLLFMVWKKIISFENNTSMGVVWFRSCSLLLVVSVVIYWGCTMYGNILGVNYKWVVQVVKTTAGLGMALNVANIAPAFIVGFAAQIKRVAISSVVTLLLVCLLVPFLTALI